MWHVWVRRKMHMFYCWSTSVYKKSFPFTKSRTKTPKDRSQPEPEDRMPEEAAEHPGNRTRRIAGAHRHLDCLARPRSATPTCLPPVQREQILRILLWKTGALAVTPSALHREHRIYSNGIITFHNHELRADANIPSRQWQKFSLSKFLGMTEYTLTGFRIFQHRLKWAVLHHDFTTAPFHSYHNIPDDRHKSSRGSCIILLRLILAFLLEKCWLTNNGRPTV